MLKRRDIVRNEPKYGPVAGDFAEHVDTKTSAFFGHVGEIEVVALFQNFFLILGQDLEYVAFQLGVRQFTELDRQQIAIHTQHGWHADRQVNVRTTLCETQL